MMLMHRLPKHYISLVQVTAGTVDYLKDASDAHTLNVVVPVPK